MSENFERTNLDVAVRDMSKSSISEPDLASAKPIPAPCRLTRAKSMLISILIVCTIRLCLPMLLTLHGKNESLEGYDFHAALKVVCSLRACKNA